MELFRYPPGINTKYIFYINLVCIALFVMFELLKDYSPLAFYGQITLVVLLILILVVLSISIFLTMLTRENISDLAVVTRATEYRKGEGLRNVLSLHLDRKLGRIFLNQDIPHSEKAAFIYQQFLLMIIEVKNGVEEGKGIYKNLHRIKAVSPLITPGRMRPLGIEVKEVTSLFDKWMMKFTLRIFRMKSSRKKQLYSFDLTIAKFKAIDEAKIYDFIKRLELKMEISLIKSLSEKEISQSKR